MVGMLCTHVTMHCFVSMTRDEMNFEGFRLWDETS